MEEQWWREQVDCSRIMALDRRRPVCVSALLLHAAYSLETERRGTRRGGGDVRNDLSA